MAAIPHFEFNITGASGSQGFLGPRNGWRAYIFPRGAHASQDSTGTLITFDSAAIASRFAVNNWLQVGLSIDNIRRVSAVGGNSLSVAGSAVTVSENDRVFLIGNTQPTTVGGSATYTIPNTLIRQRGDDAADLFTNSMITANSDGLIRGYATPQMVDVLVQDGNRTNQGFMADLEVGTVEGVSVIDNAIFGESVTIGENLIVPRIGSAAGTSSGGAIRIVDGLRFTGVQAALSDLPSDGGVVYVTGGTYTISSTISLDGMRNVHLILAPNATLLAGGTFGNSPMIRVAGAASNITVEGGTIDADSDAGECVRIGGTADRVTVRNLLCDGADTAARSALFVNGNPTNLRLQDLTFRNCEEAGIVLFDGSSASIIGLVIDGVDYDVTNGAGSNANSNPSAVNIAGLIRDFVITNVRATMRNRSNGPVAVGIDDAGGAVCERGTISNIVARGDVGNAEVFGVVLSKVNNVAVSNITGESLGRSGVEISESSASGNRYISIANVALNNCGIDATGGKPSFSIADCDRVAVANVVIEGSTQTGRGFNIANSQNCVISNLTIRGGGNATPASTVNGGLNFGGAASENLLSNIFIDSFDNHGILFGASSSNNLIDNVHVRGITASSRNPIAMLAGASSNFVRGIRLSNNTLGVLNNGTLNGFEFAEGTSANNLTQDATLTIPGGTFFGISGTLGSGTSISAISPLTDGRSILLWAAAGTMGFSSSNALQIVGNSFNVPVNGAVQAFCTGTTWFVFSPSS